MDFRVLGPVGAWSQGQRRPVSGSVRHALLALLLLRANQVAPTDWLIDTLWESVPPRTAATSLQVMVHRLRRAFDPEQDRLRTEPHGYLLRVADREFDLEVFGALAARARVALAERSYPDAAGALREALGLWRGPVLGGASPIRLIRDEAARLDELRLAAQEDLFGAELALGLAANLIDELTRAVTAHPTRERLRGQLMLALHRCERTADALAAYRAGRAISVRELGLEPGAVLQDLHAQILRNDPQLWRGPDNPATGAATAVAEPAPAPPLAQLPHGATHFIGRARELAALATLGDTRSAPVVTVNGMPGVGKTALALHFAHRIADRWPDGQLYLDLHGFDPGQPPTDPAHALYQLLSALGAQPGAIPVGTDERSALYRSMLSRRRVLVMLDNAASVGQVRPLLPGTGACPVVVTSRNRLTGLIVHDGARPLTVAPLSIEDSLELLTAVLGPARVAVEPHAARELARHSGGLPLALRISAANLVTHPDQTIAAFVADFSSSPLDALHVDGDEHSAARLAFDVSYRCLPTPARRLFCLLGAAPGAGLATAAVAALAGATSVQVAADLDRLAAAHLVEQYPPGRWHQHDLLRRYAAERAGRDETDDVQARSVAGLLRHYLSDARAAVDLLYPRSAAAGPPAPASTTIVDAGKAVAWFDRERFNLVTSVLFAAEHGVNPVAWQLADVTVKLFLLRHHPHDWIPIGRAALAAAARAGDDDGVAHLHLSLGNATYSAGDNEAAAAHYTQAIDHATAVGWPTGAAAARANLGVIYAGTGRPRVALEHYQHALYLQRGLGGRYGEAIALDNIGGIYHLLGRLHEALEHHWGALAIHREIGFRAGEALALANAANALRELGRLDEALDACAKALEAYQEIGSRTGRAQALCCMSDIHADAGRRADARVAAEAALAVTEDSGDQRSMSEALNILGALATAAGHFDEATTRHERALELAVTTGYQLEIQEALLGLADVHRGRGDPDTALLHARRALGLARRGEDTVAEPALLIALARIHLDRGARGAAVARLRAAARISERTGQCLRHTEAVDLLAAGDVPTQRTSEISTSSVSSR